jgi:hypothetical protein
MMEDETDEECGMHDVMRNAYRILFGEIECVTPLKRPRGSSWDIF